MFHSPMRVELKDGEPKLQLVPGDWRALNIYFIIISKLLIKNQNEKLTQYQQKKKCSRGQTKQSESNCRGQMKQSTQNHWKRSRI